MGLIGDIIGNFLGPLGKKAAQWIPSKREIMERKIDEYKADLKRLESLPWTVDIGREHDRINKLLQSEEANLKRHLGSN